MFKGNITAGSVNANANVPITKVFNTNQKVGLVDNQVEIYKNGLWSIEATVNFTATDTQTTADLVINGVTYQSVEITTASGSEYQVVFNDAEIVKNAPYNETVQIAIQFNTAVTTLGGTIIVKYES